MKKFEVRYVFDIGSSNTKSYCCVVDKANDRIISIIDSITVAMPYQEYINNSHNNELSPEAFERSCEAMTKILSYYNIAPKDNPKLHCAGIATAWARNAVNSQELIDKINNQFGVHIEIASQQLEGELGVRALKANPIMHMDKYYSVLDIGGGSFQLGYHSASDDIYVYNGPYGAVNYANEMRALLGVGGNAMLNVDQLHSIINIASKKIACSISEYLVTTNMHGNVYAIGNMVNKSIKPLVTAMLTDHTSKNAHNYHYDKHSVTIEEMFTLVSILGTNDEAKLHEMYPELSEYDMHTAQTNVTLLCSIMESADIHSVEFLEHVKSLDAIAVYEDLW